ncbi:MAG: hypothetical protein D6736_16760, partial [Nitrospinota bacterium]
MASPYACCRSPRPDEGFESLSARKSYWATEIALSSRIVSVLLWKTRQMIGKIKNTLHSSLLPAEPSPLLLWGILTLVAMLLLFLKLSSPNDLMDKDQERPAAYVMDVVQNGHWVVQTDIHGDITSKPPLYTWLAALASLPFGHANLFTLSLPSALSLLVSAWLVFIVGSRSFNISSGFFSALTLLVSMT